ncbi:hypothetical protein BTO30_11695 [Domibacillus antri]|uniref:Histidine kinase/HSP90-like ATPase domain-containing protein n=1 Tax=Domibacillus antri TaxID=1714264 RepID=A0A1Q8Q3S1_9BACI|nr:ATP-binding protein [Domibacillus antri]OLN21990.1 hypothetical protein BTO30_11695 [Domibacillus antri]
MNLIFPEYLNCKSVESLLSFLNKCDGNFEAIDLSNIKFVFPYGLNMMLHVLEQVEHFEDIIFPSDKIMSYLIRMDFFKRLEDTWELPEEILYDISLHDYGKNEDNKTLLELTKIEHFTHVFPVLQKVDEKVGVILKAQLGYTDRDVKKFKDILDELCQNISRHCQSHGYVSVQYIPYYFSQSRRKYDWPVKIGITDTGIGFAATYSENFDDETALKEAVIENRSSKLKGGMGLKYIKNYIKEFEGELFIRSGTACYYQEGKKGYSTLETNMPFFKGSQIDITLPSKK